jgi:hypothetical protein
MLGRVHTRNAHFDWRLTRDVASRVNSCLLLAVPFPLILHWTGALRVAEVSPQSPQHTRAFLKFCLALTAFCGFVSEFALGGIYRKGSISFRELIGAAWIPWLAISAI